MHPGRRDLLVLAARLEKLREPIEDFLRDVFDLNVESDIACAMSKLLTTSQG